MGNPQEDDWSPVESFVKVPPSVITDYGRIFALFRGIFSMSQGLHGLGYWPSHHRWDGNMAITMSDGA